MINLHLPGGSETVRFFLLLIDDKPIISLCVLFDATVVTWGHPGNIIAKGLLQWIFNVHHVHPNLKELSRFASNASCSKQGQTRMAPSNRFQFPAYLYGIHHPWWNVLVEKPLSCPERESYHNLMTSPSLPQKISEILLMAEILHQLIGSLSHYLQGFIHPRWFSRQISEPSVLVSGYLGSRHQLVAVKESPFALSIYIYMYIHGFPRDY